MTDSRLATRLVVQALVRRCSFAGLSAVVARRGDEERGAMLLKVNRFEAGVTVWTQTRTPDGQAAWMRGTGADPVAETVSDAYVERQVKRDPDLWVIEIEDRQARFTPDGRLV
ncbi:MAG: DUF1491 family protein [Rhodospirillales bacterium]